MRNKISSNNPPIAIENQIYFPTYLYEKPIQKPIAAVGPEKINPHRICIGVQPANFNGTSRENPNRKDKRASQCANGDYLSKFFHLTLLWFKWLSLGVLDS
jgi:hypothetical protein